MEPLGRETGHDSPGSLFMTLFSQVRGSSTLAIRPHSKPRRLVVPHKASGSCTATSGTTNDNTEKEGGGSLMAVINVS
jgi:hypothetical protein